MESVLGRYRNLVILVGVLFLQALGLAVQVKRGSTDAADTRLIRIWAVDAITPFERGLVWVRSSGGNIWRNYFYLRGVRAENRQLKDQIEQMRLEQVRLGEDAAQARRLQGLLSFKEQFISKTIAAQVIGSSGSDSSRILYIDKGDNDHLKRDMAVITSDGIVGKVFQVFPSVSQVLLISDQSSGVGTILEKSRLQGFLKGKADGEVMLEGIMSDEQVAQGERVLTSGGDQIFPKGLPVGLVTNVSIGKDLFLNISVKPSANLSKLEEVLVLTEKQERQAVAEDSTRVRAADILAQRLPQVPPKPADPKTVPEASQPKANGAATPKPQGGTTAVSKPAAPKPPMNSAISPASTAAGAAGSTPPETTSGGAVKPKPVPSQSQPENTPPAQANPQAPDDNQPH